jgi:hypothetical protein
VAGAERDSIKIDVSGETGSVPLQLAAELRAAAAADAARSSVRRDLSLLFERAVSTGTTLALRRSEARELEALLREGPATAERTQLLEFLGQLAAGRAAC